MNAYNEKKKMNREILKPAKVMFAIYEIAFAPARKPYQIGLLFTHKER